MSILFSQSVSFVLEALTTSEMKLGQWCGHSCFTIWTRMTFSLFMKSFCSRYAASSDDLEITRLTTNDLMPAHCSAGSVFHRYLIALSKIYSQHNGPPRVTP